MHLKCMICFYGCGKFKGNQCKGFFVSYLGNSALLKLARIWYILRNLRNFNDLRDTCFCYNSHIHNYLEKLLIISIHYMIMADIDMITKNSGRSKNKKCSIHYKSITLCRRKHLILLVSTFIFLCINYKTHWCFLLFLFICIYTFSFVWKK